MIIRSMNEIEFPRLGWLSTHVVGPQNGRMLIEVRGHSGMSSWPEGLITVPESSIDRDRIFLKKGIYEIVEAQDRNGRRLLRFYAKEKAKTDLILFAAEGFLNSEASSEDVQLLLECQGHSRTMRHSSEWSLIIAPVGATVAVDDNNDDPVYYKVTGSGIIELGASNAVIAPDEW